MRDAAVERLSRLLSDPPRNDSSNNGKKMRPGTSFQIRLGLSEGWFSLILLAIVVYSTIWSVQVAGWVTHLNILTLTTALGLVTGVIAAKQERFPRLATHLLALAVGLLLAFWQTAGAFYQGSAPAFIHGIQHWVAIVLSGGSSDDDSLFLFFIVALSFVLAYTSAWLVYRTRSPWLMIVANAVVLLINLSNVDEGYIIFLTVFLIGALLLLLRFNLYESMKRWRRQGLRYADDIGWDVMQAGVLISIGILIFSWIMPSGYINPVASTIWSANANPWVQLQNTFDRAFSISGGANPANHGNFRDTLVLAGNPNLNHEVVMTVQSNDDGSQYLAFLNYDTYQGRAGWTNGSTGTISLKANQVYNNAVAVMTHSVQQKVTIVNPPGEQKGYLPGQSEIEAASVPATVQGNASGTVIAWLNANGNLTAGSHYTITSYASSADVVTLRSVPMPADEPTFPSNYDGPLPPTVYDPQVVKTYEQLPSGLDPAIHQLALSITANAHTMYDKVVALETYLRTHYSYSVDIQLPPGEEGVSWFLFRSGNKGFCNYFSSSMAIMARSLGIPARVEVGYTNGDNDAKNHQRVIHGTDAHSWTQVYFAGYGWINFEPSASFASFSRPLPNQFPSSGSTVVGGSNGGLNQAGNGRTHLPNHEGGNVGDSSTTNSTQTPQEIRQQIGFAFGSLVLLILLCALLFSIWWSRLFRRYGMAAQLYGRLCVLASWAGIELRRSQTPYEYIQELAVTVPNDAATLERLSDIYVRDRWADPESKEHPRRTGEISELQGLWRRLQPRLFYYVMRHPHFLRWLPQRVWTYLVKKRRQIRARRIVDEDL